MLFKRESIAKRLWRELHEGLEPTNQKLKEELGFPKHNRNVLWDELVFESAIHIYAEALNCFHHRLFEASTIMCRIAIDSAIYLGWRYVRTEDLLSPNLREPSTLKARALKSGEKTEWKWGELSKQAVKLGLLEKADIEYVRKVREKGNFSAHLAIIQDEYEAKWITETAPLYEAWLKEAKVKQGQLPPPPTPGYKRWTTQEEALSVITETKDILIKIIQNYFTSEKTGTPSL